MNQQKGKEDGAELCQVQVKLGGPTRWGNTTVLERETMVIFHLQLKFSSKIVNLKANNSASINKKWGCLPFTNLLFRPAELYKKKIRGPYG